MITETPAVTTTEPASVTETVETPEVSLQERLNKATPEEYTNWERTGDIPPVKPKSDPPPPKTEAPAASKEPSAVEAGEKKPPVPTETAAATEAARPQKKRSGDSRILQLLEENKRDREAAAARIAELEARLPKAEPDAKAAPSTAPGDRPKPQASDLDPVTGKPKYKTMEEVWDARDVWNEERREKAEQERKRAADELLLETELTTRLKPAYEKHADFVEVTSNSALILPKGSAVDLFLRDSENPGELLYHLGKNPQILEGFYNFNSKTGQWSNKVNPARQFRELTAIENSLTEAPKPAPVAAQVTTPKPSATTQPLPPPPTVLSAHGAPSGDPVEEAVKKKSFADYEKAANDAERKARRR